MGGGRCHFHDCKQKNDGVIHMFRYPVFDKVRCYRWLVATGRMDLLSFKVSQVRNKQICQHHFRDYDFMNALKNSLKPTAIPILAGPFCTGLKELDPDDFPLMLDQIEDEILMPRDMKPESLNSKLYYYLTTPESEGISSASMKPETQKVSVTSYDYLNLSKHGPMKNQIVVIENPANLNRRQKTIGLPGNILNPEKFQTPRKLAPTKKAAPKCIDVHGILEEFDENPGVKILSQKTVSPSNLINQTPIKLAELKRIDPGSHVIGNKNVNSLLKDNIKQEISIVKINEKENSVLQRDSQNNENNTVAAVAPKIDNNTPKVVDKQDLPISEEAKVPEPAPQDKNQSEFIQEKRKFNRRLRDIIRESIDMADSRTPKEEAISFVAPTPEPKVVKVKSVKDTSNVEPLIAISQLQNRLQTMEALLLNRIDANTKEVNDLKKLLEEKNKAEIEKEKEATKVKMETSHEDRKKRLFNEISEYLSKESKSQLYEQLFVSKYPKRTRR